MTALCVGFGLVWLVVTLRGATYTVSGFIGITLMLGVCYGLGTVTLMLLKVHA